MEASTHGTMEANRWETKDVIIGLNLTVTVPFLSTVPRRAGKGANYLIKQRLSHEAKNNWLPVGPTDFASLWKARKVKYEQRAAMVGGTWHLISASIEMQRLIYR